MNRWLFVIALFVLTIFFVVGCAESFPMARQPSQSFQETLDSQRAVKHAMQTDQRQELVVPGMSAAVILPDGSTWLGVSGKSSDSEAMSSVSSIYLYFPEDNLTITVLGNLMVDLKPVALALRRAYVENQK